MIRILKPSDIDAVMNIWLSSNIQAHSFIPREYWMKYFGQVKEMLPDATVYVYEDNGSVQGFIGLPIVISITQGFTSIPKAKS